jgi:hypothetical protein
MDKSQNKFDIDGPNQLVQQFSDSHIAEVHISAKALLDIYLIWFGYIATSSGEEGDIVQAVPIDKQKCGVLYGTVKNLCLGSRVCTR